MTHPHPPASPLAPRAFPAPDAQPRSNSEYRWTPDKALAFLGALADCGKVAAAARAVGMTRQSAYRLKARSALVAQAWPLALAAGRERRALRGRGDPWDHRAAQGNTSQGYRSQGCSSLAAGPQGYIDGATW